MTEREEKVNLARAFPKVRPVFRSFLSDIFGHVDQLQEYSHCASFEVRLADCIEAYGYPLAEIKCNAYLKDFRECVFCPKQLERRRAMYRKRGYDNFGQAKFTEPPVDFEAYRF